MARRKSGNVPDANVARIMAMATAREPLSARDIAAELNRLRVPTARGGAWHHRTVLNVIRRTTEETP